MNTTDYICKEDCGPCTITIASIYGGGGLHCPVGPSEGSNWQAVTGKLNERKEVKMSEFKVGDKVKIASNSSYLWVRNGRLYGGDKLHEEAIITEIGITAVKYNSYVCDLLLNCDGDAVFISSKHVTLIAPEIMHNIAGKDFSESTIKAALRAHVG